MRCHARDVSRAPAEPSAHEGAERVDREDEHEHRDQQRRRLRLLEDREVEVEQLAEPAGADEAEHRRHADVHLETVKRVGDPLRRDEGQRPTAAASARETIAFSAPRGTSHLVDRALAVMEQSERHHARAQRARNRT